MATVTNAIFYGNSLREVYPNVCKMVVQYGKRSSPRGELTSEVLCPTIVIDDPGDCFPSGVGRWPKPRIAAVEAVQLCGAFTDPVMTVSASKAFQKYREPYTGHFHGAYGRRIGNQALSVMGKLEKDHDSRRAMVVLWDPGLDHGDDKLDYPCTVSLQFLIRDDKLVCVTNMRSNDVWLGLAYDLFQFGQLQCTIANYLEVEVGELVHRPVSLHAYERDFEKIAGLGSAQEVSDHYPPRLEGFSSINAARIIGSGNYSKLEDPTLTERWFMHTLADLEREVRPRG